MDSNSTITIGALCLLVGAAIGYIGFLKGMKKDVKEEAQSDTKEKVQLNTKLDILLSNNTEIKGEVKNINDKFDKFKDDANERLTRVEESVKSAHKRIDGLEDKK